jgi:hypothetical protein
VLQNNFFQITTIKSTTIPNTQKDKPNYYDKLRYAFFSVPGLSALKFYFYFLLKLFFIYIFISCVDIKNNFFFKKNIILIYFKKNILNYNHNFKQLSQLLSSKSGIINVVRDLWYKSYKTRLACHFYGCDDGNNARVSNMKTIRNSIVLPQD